METFDAQSSTGCAGPAHEPLRTQTPDRLHAKGSMIVENRGVSIAVCAIAKFANRDSELGHRWPKIAGARNDDSRPSVGAAMSWRGQLLESPRDSRLRAPFTPSPSQARPSCDKDQLFWALSAAARRASATSTIGGPRFDTIVSNLIGALPRLGRIQDHLERTSLHGNAPIHYPVQRAPFVGVEVDLALADRAELEHVGLRMS